MELNAQIELMDHEIMECERIGRELHEKYSSRTINKANLLSLVHEAEDKFREVGLEIEVHLGSRILQEGMGIEVEDPDGTVPENFTISVAARAEHKPFDPDRMEFDVASGVADDFWERQRTKSAPTEPTPPMEGHEH